MVKRAFLYFFMVFGCISQSYSYDATSINGEKLIYQYLIGKHFSNNCYRLMGCKNTSCDKFFTANIDLVQSDLPDTLERIFVSEVFPDLQENVGNEDSRSFLEYHFHSTVNINEISLVVSKCGFSKNKKYAMLYYEIVTGGLGGTGVFATFYLKDLWCLISETNIWVG